MYKSTTTERLTLFWPRNVATRIMQLQKGCGRCYAITVQRQWLTFGPAVGVSCFE